MIQNVCQVGRIESPLELILLNTRWIKCFQRKKLFNTTKYIKTAPSPFKHLHDRWWGAEQEIQCMFFTFYSWDFVEQPFIIINLHWKWAHQQFRNSICFQIVFQTFLDLPNVIFYISYRFIDYHDVCLESFRNFPNNTTHKKTCIWIWFLSFRYQCHTYCVIFLNIRLDLTKPGLSLASHQSHQGESSEVLKYTLFSNCFLILFLLLKSFSLSIGNHYSHVNY